MEIATSDLNLFPMNVQIKRELTDYSQKDASGRASPGPRVTMLAPPNHQTGYRPYFFFGGGGEYYLLFPFLLIQERQSPREMGIAQ